MVASIVGYDLDAEHRKELNNFRFNVSQASLQTQTHKPPSEELRIFECGHSYHRHCIDKEQDYGKNDSDGSDQEDSNAFFNKRRDNRLSLYDIHQLNVAR